MHCRATYREAVSQEARIEVAHAWKMFKPQIPSTIITVSSARHPSTLHGETSKPGSESATIMYAKYDLFIVEKWRIDGEVLALLNVDVNKSVDLSEDPHSGLDTIKQISIP
jgi:hypothetical protein